MIVLNIIFNTFILGLILLIGLSFSKIDPNIAWYSAFAITGGLTIIGYTRLGSIFINIFIPGRKAISREHAKLEPLLQEIIFNVHKEYGINYSLSDFKIKISDSKIANVLVISYDTILITSGAFETFSDGQLQAILAHEIAHLYYHDSLKRTAILFSSFPALIILSIYNLYVLFTTFLTRVIRGKHASALVLLGWILIIFFLPFIMLNWLGKRLFNLLNMYMSRKEEFRADIFAAKLGYKEDMISALEIIDKLSETDNSFLGRLTASHPTCISRIGALEDSNI